MDKTARIGFRLEDSIRSRLDRFCRLESYKLSRLVRDLLVIGLYVYEWVGKDGYIMLHSDRLSIRIDKKSWEFLKKKAYGRYSSDTK